LARIDRQVDAIVAEHASSYWRRGAARHEDWPSVGWTIDNEVVLELRVAERGPAELVVHDFSLVDPIRRALRTRHVNIRYATFRDVRS
jgi:hypothetical protein